LLMIVVMRNDLERVGFLDWAYRLFERIF